MRDFEGLAALRVDALVPQFLPLMAISHPVSSYRLGHLGHPPFK